MALITLEMVEDRETSSGFDARRLIVPCRNTKDGSDVRCGSPVIWQSIQRKDGERMIMPFDFHPVIKEGVVTQVKLVTHNCPNRNVA